MIKALLFDLNGTVIDILTDEIGNDIYRIMSNLLAYQGIYLQSDEVRALFFEYNKEQRKNSLEEYPEFNVEAIFNKIITTYETPYTQQLSAEKRAFLPSFLAEAFRAATLFKLELYKDVRPVLDVLKKEYRMAAISDGQSLWAVPEMNRVGLDADFEFVVVSGDLGFRKPDARIYEMALAKLDLKPDEVVFVGNDMYRDVWGAHHAGMKTVFFQSNQGDHKSRGVSADYIIYEFNQLPEAIRFFIR